MKRMKKMMLAAIACLMVFAMMPCTVEAAAKKTVTVSVKNTKKTGGRVSMNKGKKYQTVVKYGKTNVTKKASYKTSNKKIATVSKKGVITAKKAGNCTIRVKYKGKVWRKHWEWDKFYRRGPEL